MDCFVLLPRIPKFCKNTYIYRAAHAKESTDAHSSCSELEKKHVVSLFVPPLLQTITYHYMFA